MLLAQWWSRTSQTSLEPEPVCEGARWRRQGGRGKALWTCSFLLSMIVLIDYEMSKYISKSVRLRICFCDRAFRGKQLDDWYITTCTPSTYHLQKELSMKEREQPHDHSWCKNQNHFLIRTFTTSYCYSFWTLAYVCHLWICRKKNSTVHDREGTSVPGTVWYDLMPHARPIITRCLLRPVPGLSTTMIHTTYRYVPSVPVEAAGWSKQIRAQ